MATTKSTTDEQSARSKPEPSEDERRTAPPESETDRVLEDDSVPLKKKQALLNAVHGLAEH